MNSNSLLPDFLSSVSIKFAHIEAELGNAATRGVLWQAAEGRFLLNVPNVARYLVESGRTIIIDPLPGADVTTIERFLRMTPLAALLFQQGRLAFHAVAIANEHGAVVIAGDSGAGKSTLMTELLLRGWKMLADEPVAVDLDAQGHAMVYPAFTKIALWPDTIKKLGIASDALSFGDANRQEYSSPEQLIYNPQPLRALYYLYTHSKNNCELEALEGSKKFNVLGKLMYNSHIADAMCERVAYMRCAISISQSAPINLLRRPRDKWSVDELADMISTQA